MNKNSIRWVILGGLFLIPFIPFLVNGSLFFPFITTKAFAFRIITEVIFGAWIILAALSPEYRPKKSVLLYSLLTFIFVIGLADLFGVAHVKSFWSNYERMEGFVTLLHLGALFIVSGSFLEEWEWKWLFNTTLVASFLMVLYCFLQLARVKGFDIHQGGVRVDGTIGNSAYLAVYMLIHAFLSILMWVREKRGSFFRYVYGFLLFTQLVVLYYTATRGAILGFLGGLLLVALLNVFNRESGRARKASLGIILLVILGVGGVFVLRNTSVIKNSPVLSRFTSINASEIKTEGRSFIWPMAIQGIKEKPILGWGQENFNYVFNEHYDPKMYNLEPWFDRAHNIFLDWGIAGGLLGLLSYLALYVFFLYTVWKKDQNLSFVEKSILTGLLAGYFFHNLFVFDNLLSYILFITLLAYLHSRTVLKNTKEGNGMSEDEVLKFVLPVASVVFLVVLYFVNIQPIIANTSLIEGLQISQSAGTDKAQVLPLLKKSYEESRLGRPETVEWISSSAVSVLSSNIKVEDKNAYFAFARKAIEDEAAEFSTDTRYQLVAASFFSQTGYPDEALKYLNRAKELTPGKQLVYFQIGESLIEKKDYVGALQAFKTAYDMAPEYTDAGVIYLVGAIYASDANLVQTLISKLPKEVVATDERISSALLTTGRFTELESLLITRINLKPTDPQGYLELTQAFLKTGDKRSAVLVLEKLAEAIPESRDQANQYIKGIQDGTLKF